MDSRASGRSATRGDDGGGRRRITNDAWRRRRMHCEPRFVERRAAGSEDWFLHADAL